MYIVFNVPLVYIANQSLAVAIHDMLKRLHDVSTVQVPIGALLDGPIDAVPLVSALIYIDAVTDSQDASQLIV